MTKTEFQLAVLGSGDAVPVTDLALLVHDADTAVGMNQWLTSAEAARNGGWPCHMFGIRRGDDLVATAGVGRSWESKIIYGFGELMTHPDHRGQGLATALVMLRAAWIWGVWALGMPPADPLTVVHATDVPEFHTRFGYRVLFDHRPVTKSAVVMSIAADVLLEKSLEQVESRIPWFLDLTSPEPLHGGMTIRELVHIARRMASAARSGAFAGKAASA